MKTNIKTKAFSLTAAAIGAYLLASPAIAYLNCPSGTVEMNGQCVVVSNGTGGQAGGGTTNTNTATGGAGGNASSDATAGAVGVGTGIGVGTGGNATTGPVNVTTGTTTATGGQGGAGGSVGDTTATSTATGGSVTGSGNSASTSTAAGGAGGQATAGVTGSGNSSSRSGVSGSGNSRNSNSVSVRNNTRIKHAASSAIAPSLASPGMANCFGDAAPSGSFSAAVQTFGWGVSAGNTKASNVCAMYQIGGERAALAYLASQDPNARRALLAAGLITTPKRQARAAAAEPAPVAQTVRCPEGSTWDGKGCWAKNLKAVSR